MMKTIAKEKPIVYSCSGCSSIAQMANYIAVKLDRKGIAEMSCIAGVGGNVKAITRTALSGRKLITIDGCPLACSKACLYNHDKKPDLYFELTEFGVSKNMHQDFNPAEADLVFEKIEFLIHNWQKKKMPESDTGGEKLFFKKQTIQPAYIAGTGITVKEVTDKKQLHSFIGFPYQLYKDNKYYIPQLKKDVIATFDKIKNPAFEFCEVRYWLAYKGDKVVGRIAAIINKAFIEKWKSKYMRFGWMDFEEDEKIAKVLLEQVERWAKEKNMTAVHGPLGFTNFDYAGFLIAGFDQLGTFATLYNYSYYPAYLERAGYRKDVDWVEYKIKVPKEIPEKLKKIATVVQKRFNLSVVSATTTDEILPYAKDIFNLINATYTDLYGVVELNEKQIEYNIKKYLSFIRADFVSLVLDKNGKLAAVSITMPSLSKALQKAAGSLYPFGFFHILKAFKTNDLVDLCLVAVRKDLQGKGVNAILMYEMNKIYIKNGVAFAESNPELEENTKVQSIWDHYDAVQHKRRRCYIKYLQS